MHWLVRACFAVAMACPLLARPIPLLGISELMSSAEVVVTIKPKSFIQTKDKPDDGSFGDRDLSRYLALETTCEVTAVIKGSPEIKTVKIVHFVYAGDKPDFNGSLFMSFLFGPVRLGTFPLDEKGKPNSPRGLPYALGDAEFLAFLRKLPDGRYAAAAPQYDASIAFRLLSYPTGAQFYPVPNAAKMELPAK